MRLMDLSVLALCVACSSPQTYIFDPTADGGDGGNGIDPDACDPFSGCTGNFDGALGDTNVYKCVPDPGNFDILGNNCDDDGDGQIDNPPNCDANLLATGNATAFAQSIELCQSAGGGKWGVVSAAYQDGFQSNTAPAADQHGILKKFGGKLKPRANKSLGALSSGYAQEYDQCNTPNSPFKGGCSMVQKTSAAPPGYPKANVGCPISDVVNDYSSIKLTIQVPKNAKGFSYDFNFGSGEWPEFVCTTFNDSYIAYMKSSAFNGGKPENISFDKNNNPLSVNNAFFDRCSPVGAEKYCTGVATVMAANKAKPPACAGGNTDLVGTGFYDVGPHCAGPDDSGGGMTGWLTTKAPVTPGETITIEFMVWDTGDHIYDSSVLIDNWQWQGDATTIGTDRPPN